MLKKCCALFLCFSLITGLSSYQFSYHTYDTDKDKKAALRTIIIDAGHGLPDPGAQGKYSNESDITLAISKKLGERLQQVLPDCKIVYTRTDENLPFGMTDRNKANRQRAQFANENRGDLFIAIHVNSAKERYERRIEGYREQTYYVTVGKGRKKRKVAKTRQVPIVKHYKLPCRNKGTETYIWAVDKYNQKKQSVSNREDELYGEQKDSSYNYFDSPEAKIFASLRTKKYFDRSLMIANYVEEEFTKVGRISSGVKQRNNQGIWVLQATNMPSILVETGFICIPEEEDYLNSEVGQNEISYAVMRAVLRYKQSLENLPQNNTDSIANRLEVTNENGISGTNAQ